jgi:hypothetical protein
MVGQLMNNDLGSMWKEAVAAHFEAVSRNLPAGTKENHKKSQERWCLQEKI